MDQAGAVTSLWEKKNLCIQIFRSQILIFHIPAVICSGGYFFLFVCLFWKHKHCHIALTWHNFIWVIFCEIIQVEKQLQSFQISTETEEMSRDYLIYTNTEAGSKDSLMEQMPDCPNPENSQESRMQPPLVFHPQNPSSWGKVFLSAPTTALMANNCSLDTIQSVQIFS